jgi:hypothetical protein
MGTHQHLKRYLAEFDFRYNERAALGVTDAERATKTVAGVVGKRMTYQKPAEGSSGTAQGWGALPARPASEVLDARQLAFSFLIDDSEDLRAVVVGIRHSRITSSRRRAASSSDKTSSALRGIVQS